MSQKKTFMMLKPDALDQGLALSITSYFKKYGFTIEAFNVVTATKELTAVHYEEVIGRLGEDFGRKMFDYFCGKTVVPMILCREEGDAIEEGRRMIGATNPIDAAPGTIRGDLCDDSYEKSKAENRCVQNLIHASDSEESVKREVSIWLPGYEL